jgi:hypothetical protein
MDDSALLLPELGQKKKEHQPKKEEEPVSKVHAHYIYIFVNSGMRNLSEEVLLTLPIPLKLFFSSSSF